MNNRVRRNNAVTVAAVVAAAVFVAFTAFIKSDSNIPLFIAAGEALLLIAVIVYLIASERHYLKNSRKYMLRLMGKLDCTDSNALNDFPFPVVVCSEDGAIQWCSEKFLNRVIGNLPTVEENVYSYFNGKDLYEIINSDQSAVFVNDRTYTVYSNSYEFEGNQSYILFFIDNSDLRQIEKKYYDSKPWVIMIESDNILDTRYDFRDSERAEIRSMIENEIEKWVGNFTCIMKKTSENRYFIIAEKSDVDKMIEEKFTILDSVRDIKYKNYNSCASLSIGVSDGDTLIQCEKGARNALEMALGRGGDQAAVSSNDSFQFFGGVSKSFESQGKVKTRIIASAFRELIEGSDNVLVMGHRSPDLDAIGAALGVCCACEASDVPAFIVTDKNKTICPALIGRILEDENQNVSIIDEQTAINLMSRKTLLVVVDTHIKNYVEFPELYNSASTVVVIDHHRKSVNFIDNATVFYHDPGASSACEMVTELLEYMGTDVAMDSLTSEALLSGIMLDTKNFVLNTGVRTFSAAAYLRKNGADTVRVHKMFANTFENYKLKNKIISLSKTYKNCAFSVADFRSDELRVICSQAADEMLNIEGVKASFVLFESGSKVCVSARSYGEVNVQIIMEALGGGGHQTMAAAQMENETIDSVIEKICGIIDDNTNN